MQNRICHLQMHRRADLKYKSAPETKEKRAKKRGRVTVKETGAGVYGSDSVHANGAARGPSTNAAKAKKPQRARRKPRAPSKCSNCKTVGHTINKCPMPRKRKASVNFELDIAAFM